MSLPGSELGSWEHLESLPDPQNANLFPTHRLPRKGFIGLSNWKGEAFCEFRNIRVKS